jgi:hypothetical protein
VAIEVRVAGVAQSLLDDGGVESFGGDGHACVALWEGDHREAVVALEA